MFVNGVRWIAQASQLPSFDEIRKSVLRFFSLVETHM